MASTLTIGGSFFNDYLEQCKKFVKTVVIKSSTSASLVNDFLKLKYGKSIVDDYSPETWKYYLNISGEYHSTDTLMTVVSLDTQETINFTKENLEIHKATKEAYGYGSRYYYSLLKRYPEQDQLILGILYPVDITKAIHAEDGSILGYPSGLIEDQEQTLIIELEQFIKGYWQRWNVPAFGITDSLYFAAFHAQLYLTIYPKLLNLRLKRCHTSEVHSFHVREYLASHMYLHKYLPYLNLKQALYLYRNINYLNKNAGKTETFDELVQKILTERRIALSEYSIRQLSSFDENYYPNITSRRKPINPQYNTAEIDYIDINALYDKEKTLAYGNSRYYDSEATNTTHQFKVSNSSVVQTKDLESNMVDYSDAVPDPLERVLMRQWVSMVKNGFYNVSVIFKDPKTGETRTLYAKDALIYYQYVFFKSAGFSSENIPMVQNWKARKILKPTVQQLLSVVDSKFSDLPVIAKDILDNQPVIEHCFSVQAFYELNYKVYDEAKRHWFMTSMTGDFEKRGYLQGMILQLYEDQLVVLDTEATTMAEWLSKASLPVYDYTLDQAKELLMNIFMAATGFQVDDTRLLKNVQRNLIDLMMELSSYTVQTIVEINDSAVKLLNWPAVRPGNIQAEASWEPVIPINNRVENIASKALETIAIESGSSFVHVPETKEMKQTIPIEVANQILHRSSTDYEFSIPYPSFFMIANYPEYDPNVSNTARYVGKEYYLALSDEQKMQLKSLPI